jgi:hypothetical protein
VGSQPFSLRQSSFDAQAETAEVLRLDRTFTISGTATSLAVFKHANDHEHFFGALRKTGLPVSSPDALARYAPLSVVHPHLGTGPTCWISKPGCEAATAIWAPHRM